MALSFTSALRANHRRFLILTSGLVLIVDNSISHRSTSQHIHVPYSFYSPTFQVYPFLNMLARSFTIQSLLLLLFCVSFSSAQDDPLTLKGVNKKNFAYTDIYRLPSLQHNDQPSMLVKEPARRVRTFFGGKLNKEQMNEEVPSRKAADQAPRQTKPKRPSNNRLRAAPPQTARLLARSNFLLQNGQDAQHQNAHFASLTAHSPCSPGENACVGSGFAHCVGGKFAVTPCGRGLMCFALPLMNHPGTSITCTTHASAEAQIAATGARGGITGR